MAFDPRGFVGAAHGAGRNRIFHYNGGTDAVSTAMVAANYFDSVADMLNEGDIILACGDGEHATFAVASITAGVVTLAPTEATGLVLLKPITLAVEIPALGTASSKYVHPAVPDGYVGTVTRVTGVAYGNGDSGTATITVTVPGPTAVATLPFPASYVAGTLVEDVSIANHTGIDDDGVITVATDGTGDMTAGALVTIELTLGVAA